MQWNWTAEKTAQWLQPAIEAPYLALRWHQQGFHDFLDNGCGPGRHAMFFAARGFGVTALDQSEQALDYLQNWAKQDGLSVNPVKGDLFQMPFAPDSFDCIMDYNASYHTDTAGYRQAIAQMRRVLRPGGEVYLTLLSQNDPGRLKVTRIGTPCSMRVVRRIFTDGRRTFRSCSWAFPWRCRPERSAPGARAATRRASTTICC